MFHNLPIPSKFETRHLCGICSFSVILYRSHFMTDEQDPMPNFLYGPYCGLVSVLGLFGPYSDPKEGRLCNFCKPIIRIVDNYVT